MALTKYAAPAAVLLIMLGCAACAGRRADATPTGETVEVAITPDTAYLPAPAPAAADSVN